MATKKRSKKSEAPKVPKKIFANASPHSLGGVSLFDVEEQVTSEVAANFTSEPALVQRAVEALRQAKFEVLGSSATTINFAGSPKAFTDAFGVELVAEERPVIKDQGEESTATFIESPNTDRPGFVATRGTAFEDVLEGVAIEEPRYFMALSPFPPKTDYWHLEVPHDVSLGCNADRAHRGGRTGKGIRVAMCDSGWYKHPFFVERGYRASPVVLGPGASNPKSDDNGHGTGESANIFAVAPDVQLLPVKMSFVNSKGAFDAAVALGPHIITNSWGSSKAFGPLSAADQALAASIAAAVASGIIVIFSAGNGHWGFPGQHPDVISAGGVYMNGAGDLQASDYSSGFMSNIYPGRRVPDLSGLVGMSPGASYIMLPLQGNSSIDQSKSGGNHPPGDETAPDDGWAAFSGTSAAAPQLAGAAALVKQTCPKLSPAKVREILMKSARDVTQGNCHPATGGNAAVVGPDTATGNGLVDAYKAALLAKLNCLTIQPITIHPPIHPPIQPITIQPIRPIQPPIQPIQPIRPIPISPAGEATAQAQAGDASGLTEEEARDLEDMILRSEPGLEDLDSE